MEDNSSKSVVIIGAGVSGLIAAKEMLGAGFKKIRILEKENSLGGVWTKYCWDNLTLTSSKWVTEFGCFPMPDEYPTFLTPDLMMDYLNAFCDHYDLKRLITFDVRVTAICRDDSGRFSIQTSDSCYFDTDFVIVCSGLHGKPAVRQQSELNSFKGEVIHGHCYKEASSFQNKRVLCQGMGESGVGIASEISNVAAKTIVSASHFYLAPRVFPFNNQPFDQLQFRAIGQYMRDYQELLTSGTSWITKLPKPLCSLYIKRHAALRSIPKEWLPRAVIPNFWAAKFWPKPQSSEKGASGNLTRPDAPTDDIIYLIKTGKIIPKGKIERFVDNKVIFLDGSTEEIDVVVANTGFEPAAKSIQFPSNWTYNHRELYKGCIHPTIPGLAFVGHVRPTIGSIPAMAEMQARLVSLALSGAKKLPSIKKLTKLTKKEADKHSKRNPILTKNWPHIYFFEDWMEEMAKLIGSKPTIWSFLRSWKHLKAFLFGSPMPLRYRMFGPGAEEDGKKRYIDRTHEYLSTPPLPFVVNYLFLGFFYPHTLAAGIGFSGYLLGLSVSESAILSIIFWLLYMKVEIFRFIFFFPYSLPIYGSFYKSDRKDSKCKAPN